VAAHPDLVIESITLVADSGWHAPQSFTVESATVNDNTFLGAAGCTLPDATIQISEASGAPVVAKSIQPGDDDTMFTADEDECAYHYNLVNPGPGTYTVDLVVGGQTVGTTTFTVSCSKGNGKK
jgi:hypothetical protein